MNKLHHLIAIFSLSVLMVLPLSAAERSEAETAAAAVAHFNSGHVGHRAPAKVQLRHVERMSDATPALYVYTAGEEGGFVLISAEDKVDAVIAYGNSKVNETDLSPEFRWWMQRYAHQIEQLRKTSFSAAVTTAKTYTPITPIMGSTWHQHAPFNNQCPSISGERCPVGCVATAISQVMRYHQYPTQGTGSSSYNWNGRQLSANYGNTTYNWAQMPLDGYANMTMTQNSAVATLCYHVGVAAEMDYDRGGSGTQTTLALRGMVDYFGYDAAIDCHVLDLNGANQILDIIHDELSAGRPVVMDGATTDDEGHCFVCEGMDANGKLYINWGWGGNSDGYFRITLLDPNDQGTGGSASDLAFTERVCAFTGIRPNVGGTAEQILTCDSIAPHKTAISTRHSYAILNARNLTNNGLYTITATSIGIGVFAMDSTYIAMATEDCMYDISGLGTGYYYSHISFYLDLESYAPGNYLLALCQRDDNTMNIKPIRSGIGGAHYFVARVTNDSAYISDPIVTIPGYDYTPTSLTLSHTQGGEANFSWSSADEAPRYRFRLYQNGEEIFSDETSRSSINISYSGTSIISDLNWSVQAISRAYQNLSAETFAAPFDMYPTGQTPPGTPVTPDSQQPNPADSLNNYSAYNFHYDNTIGGRIYLYWSVQDTAKYYELSFYTNGELYYRDTITNQYMDYVLGGFSQQVNMEWSVRPMNFFRKYLAREEYAGSFVIYAEGSGPGGKVYNYTPTNLTADASTNGEATMTWTAVDRAMYYAVRLYHENSEIWSTLTTMQNCSVEYDGEVDLTVSWSVRAINEGFYVISNEIDGGTFTIHPVRPQSTEAEQIVTSLQPKTTKILRNGKLHILRGNQIYDITGSEIY